MPMWTKLLHTRERALALVEKISWIGPALVRLTLAFVFIESGWGKLHNLEKVTGYFASLHIPAPHLNAIVASSTEFFGGIAILLGLLTRLAALPMAFTMVIAVLTAKRDDIDSVGSFFGLVEVSYLVMFLWLAVAGPGKLSLDHLLGRLLTGTRPTAAKPSLHPAGAPSRG
jgi:putative oxidoreductase